MCATKSTSLAYTLAIGVVEGFELDHIRMSDNAHDLQFAVLLHISSVPFGSSGSSYLEPLVLEDTLDGRILTRW